MHAINSLISYYYIVGRISLKYGLCYFAWDNSHKSFYAYCSIITNFSTELNEIQILESADIKIDGFDHFEIGHSIEFQVFLSSCRGRDLKTIVQGNENFKKVFAKLLEQACLCFFMND